MDHRVTFNTLIGFEGTGDAGRAALVTLHRGRPRIDALWEVSKGASAVNPLYSSFPQNLPPPPKDALVVSCLRTSEVLIRPLEVQLTRDKDIDAVVKFQAEPIIPYPLEEALLDWQKVSQSEEGSNLTAYVVRKERMQEHLQGQREISLDPEVVSCIPEAVAAFLRAFLPDTKDAVIIHLGRLETSCILVTDKHLISSYTIDAGCDGFYKALAEDLNVTYEEAKKRVSSDIDLTQGMPPKLSDAVEALQKHILRAVYSMEKGSIAPTPLLITGDGAFVRGLGAVLAEACNKTLVNVTSQPGVDGHKLCLFAGAIGLGLTALGPNARPINFRMEEFRFAKPWKRLRKPILHYATGCLLLTFFLLMVGNAVVSHDETQVRRRYAKLLATTEHTFEDTEKAFAKKRNTQPAASLEALSPSDIEARAYFLGSETQGTTPFPLYPKVPRVSDFLAFLATHPQVVLQDPKTEEAKPLIVVESLSYTMVKHPDLQHPREKYRVRVDLEFSTPSPREAREFHDALIAPNDIVDPQSEINWDAVRGRYRASFFLKDKTVYFGGTNS